MRLALSALVALCVLVCATAVVSGPVTDSVAFQGRLTDSGNNPVADGSVDLTLSLWSDSVSGTMLYSEVRTVQTSSGLYTTCLGCDNSSFFDIFTDSSVYLQVQLGGQPPMVPRIPMRYVPRSFLSRRVKGDISTGPNQITVGDVDGDGAVDVMIGPDSGGVSISRTGSNARSGRIGIWDSRSEITLESKSSADPLHSSMTITAQDGGLQDVRDVDSDGDGVSDTRCAISLGSGGGGGSGGSFALDYDSDNDGIPEAEASQSITPTTSSLAIKTKGTGAQRFSSGGDCDDADATLHAECDVDGDGIADQQVIQSITPTSAHLAINSKGTSAKRTTVGGDCDDTDATLHTDCDDDNDGIPDRSVVQSVTPTTAGVAIKTKGTGANDNGRVSISSITDDTSAVHDCGIDDDDDGILDRSVVQSVTPTTAGVAIKTKGTGADHNRVVSISSITDDTSAVQNYGIDDDGDTVPEEGVDIVVTPGTSSVAINTKGTGADKNRTAVTGSVNDTTASITNGIDNDDDGDPDVTAGMSVTPYVSSVAIKTKGTGADKDRTVGLTGMTDDTTASVTTSIDADGDGTNENEVDQIITPTTSSVAIKTKGTGADSNRSASSTTSTTLGEVSSVTDIDDDGDGIVESEMVQRCGADSIVQTGVVSNGSSSAVYNMRTRVNDLESKLQNIGLLRTTSSERDCDDLDASLTNSVDLNNDGSVDVSSGLSASSTRSELTQHFEDGSIPNEDDFSVTLDATGARVGLSIQSTGQWSSSSRAACTPDSVSSESEVIDNVTSEWSIHRAEQSKGGVSRVLQYHSSAGDQKGIDDDCDGISSRTTWSSSGGGSLNSVTVECSSSADPIVHSSGARLTAGGVWTNASDVNLKENFQPVDGEQILDKVESLPISEWNYKAESDEVKHIGPTAQDFQKAFGVGENDKTISTIDPAGIALAAIKELTKQNKELKSESQQLKQQNDTLQKQLNELNEKLDKLLKAK